MTDTSLRLQAALAPILAKSVDLKDLVELRTAVRRDNPSLFNTLRESDAVPLLLQSLETLFAEDVDGDLSAIEREQRLNVVVHIITSLPYPDRAKLLSDSNALATLSGLLGRVASASTAASVIETLQEISGLSIDTSGPLLKTERDRTIGYLLACVQNATQLQRWDQQQVEDTPVRMTHDDIVINICGIVADLCDRDAQKPSYAVVSVAVPLLRAVLKHNNANNPRHHAARLRVFKALLALFKCGLSDSTGNSDVDSESGDTARACSDLSDFAASADFEPLFELSADSALYYLHQYLTAFDDATVARVFTAARLTRINNSLTNAFDTSLLQQEQLPSLLASLLAHFPAFSQRVIVNNGLARMMLETNKVLRLQKSYSPTTFPHMRSAVLLLDTLLANVSDVKSAAKLFHSFGGVQFCCELLRLYATRSQNSNEPGVATATSAAEVTTAVARLLRVIRVMIASDDTSRQPSVVSSDATPRNLFVATLLEHDGTNVFELLRGDGSMQEGGLALPELKQLRTLLLDMQVIPVVVPPTPTHD